MYQPVPTKQYPPHKQKLLSLAQLAHFHCAQRGDASGAIVAAVARCNGGDWVRSITAGLMAIGEVLTPMEAAHALLLAENTFEHAARMLWTGSRIPGWGGTLPCKSEPDPLWIDVDRHLRESFPEMAEKISQVTHILHEHGKLIFPNCVCYTAAIAVSLELPHDACWWLFVAPRILPWSKAYCEALSIVAE